MAPAIPAIVGLVGTGVSVVGQIKGAKARAEQANFQAQENKRFAIETEQQAADEERNFRAAARRQLASGRAQFSASGVTGGSGEEALAESARNIEADALDIRGKGKRRADAFRRGGANAAAAAKAESAAGILGGIGTGLSGIAKFHARGGFGKLKGG
jgi:hypothetical protein